MEALRITTNHKPQLEDGYTRIANEIIERLATFRISGEEWMILLTILRKTYGYHKKEDKISISQFYNATGMAKPSICRALNKLVKKNLINKKATGSTTIYGFNKLFNTWKPLTKKRLINNAVNGVNHFVNGISNIANKRLLKSDIQKIKDTTTKDITTKDIPEHHLKYLIEIPEEHIENYIKELSVTREQILSKAKELHNYCQYKRKNYANYKLFLWNALKRDFSVKPSRYKVGKI